MSEAPEDNLSHEQLVHKMWEKDAEKQREILERYGINEATRTQISRAAREHIIAIYKEAGISVDENDFPELFLIPKENEKEFKREMKMRENESVETYMPLSNSACVSVSDNLLEDSIGIHHELMTGVGRKKRKISKKRIFFAHQQTGLITVAPGRRIFGEVLDEGLMDYFSQEFVLDSDQADITEARRKLLSYSGNKKDILHFKIRNLFADEQYVRATDLVDKLIEDGGEQMQNLLLGARSNAKKAGELVRYIDKVYGSGTGKQLFALQFKADQIYEAMNNLKKQK